MPPAATGRLGPTPGGDRAFDPSVGKFAPPIAPEDEQPPSQFKDGRIGWHRLPIRGQETVLKWFMDTNGQITGVTQQPWVGQLIDIPAPKFLLFRPTAHKNNPEPQRPPQRLPLLLVRKAPGGA